MQRRCNAHCRTTGQPCRNPPMAGARRCRMHGESGSSPQAQRAAVRRVLEAQMRGYVAVMMAERQDCLDDLAAHGLTPAVYRFEPGLRSSPDSA
jgi:hypothetical protein